jgi:hypothetical protein
MESGSQTDNSLGRSPQKLADIIGTAIALLTLTIPIMAIARFSSIDETLLKPNPISPLSHFEQ